MYKKRSFFANKQCTFCKKPATTFRLIKNKHYMLCDSEQCCHITCLRAGYFKDNIFKKVGRNYEK